MGWPKLSLPLGDSTVLERVVAALRDGGVGRVLVVIGPHVPGLAPLAERAGAVPLLLPGPTPDMRATVERGLEWAERHWAPSPRDGWLLVPADHPALSGEVVRRLCEAWGRRGDRSVVVPTFRGKRGHPTLIGWEHVAGIRALPAGVGLNVYLRDKSAETLEVEVDTDAILADLDTPEDYERLNRPGGCRG
ncbi:MAG TPA: NTP transferase domain-containing protein, partial [Gemmataceae bacterium]